MSTPPLDNASHRAETSYRDSDDFGLNRSRIGSNQTRIPNATDLLTLKQDAKNPACTAGRANDNGSTLPDVAVEPVAARSSAAPTPPHSIIPLRHFVEAGSTADPHSTTMVEHGLPDVPRHEHVSARRNPSHHAPSKPSSRAHPHAKPAAGKPTSQPVRQAVSPSAQAIVEKALKQTDNAEALKVLNEDYLAAPQNVKDAILRNPRVEQIFAIAARKANEPLTRETVGPALLQQQTHDAILDLQQAIRNLNRDFAAAISDLAVGDYQAVYDYHEHNGDLPGGELFGLAGKELLRGKGRLPGVVDLIANTSRGEDVVSRFIAMGVLNYDLDKAVNEVRSAHESLNGSDALARHGNAAAQAQLRDGSLRQKVNGATARLNAVVAAEIATRVSMTTKGDVTTRAAFDTREAQARRAGQDIVKGYADDPEIQKLVETAVAQILDGRQVKADAREAHILAAISKHFSVPTPK